MNRDTDRWVRSDEARAKLRDLLDDIARTGAHVYVLRYDTPAAVLVPVEWYEDVKRKLDNA
jgi:PHD/YefM family antitoxin component YafN of YafNO toxin-antitoxin module